MRYSPAPNALERMRLVVFSALVVIAGFFYEKPVLAQNCWKSVGLPSYSYRPFEIAIFSPVHIFHPDCKVITGISFSVIYGRTDFLYGIEMGAIMNREYEDMIGIQIAGIVNRVDGAATGMQLAGIVNRIKGDVIGVQLAGIVNRVNGITTGIQLASVSNIGGGCRGLCISGFYNHYEQGGLGFVLSQVNYLGDNFHGIEVGIANMVDFEKFRNDLFVQTGISVSFVNFAPSFYGLQMSLFNHTLHFFRGIQIGGIWNMNNAILGGRISRKKVVVYHSVSGDFKGIQISGIANTANNVYGGQISMGNYSDDLAGLQIGAFNFAKACNGVQIGVFNFCETLNGVQIGAINIATKNRLPFMVGLNIGWGH